MKFLITYCMLFILINTASAQPLTETEKFAIGLINKVEKLNGRIKYLQSLVARTREIDAAKIQVLEKTLRDNERDKILSRTEVDKKKKEIEEYKTLLNNKESIIQQNTTEISTLQGELNRTNKEKNEYLEKLKENKAFTRAIAQNASKINSVRLGVLRNGNFLDRTISKPNADVVYECPRFPWFKCNLNAMALYCEYFKERTANNVAPTLSVYLHIYKSNDRGIEHVLFVPITLIFNARLSNEDWSYYSIDVRDLSFPYGRELDSGYVYKFGISESNVDASLSYQNALQYFIMKYPSVKFP